MQQLDDRDAAILDFERQWWRYPGAKDAPIRETFGMTSTRYYQVLNHLLDQPAALVHDPMTVKRLQRQARRTQARSARRLGFQL